MIVSAVFDWDSESWFFDCEPGTGLAVDVPADLFEDLQRCYLEAQSAYDSLVAAAGLQVDNARRVEPCTHFETDAYPSEEAAAAWDERVHGPIERIVSMLRCDTCGWRAADHTPAVPS